jgi:hypothetical protein
MLEYLIDIRSEVWLTFLGLHKSKIVGSVYAKMLSKGYNLHLVYTHWQGDSFMQADPIKSIKIGTIRGKK